MDCSPPGSSVHGVLQARILEWVAIPFSRGSSQPRDRTQVSCIAGGFFTSWATREAQKVCKQLANKKKIWTSKLPGDLGWKSGSGRNPDMYKYLFKTKYILVRVLSNGVIDPVLWFSSVQFSSVAQLCPTLCDPMNHSTPGLPVHHQLPEFTQNINLL